MTMTFNHRDDSHETRMWSQILARDAAADGQFYYGVRSTGIVCRPSCPSRRPALKNVEFFPTLAKALDAGFRACMRCQPEKKPSDTGAHARLVARVAKHLREHADEGQSITEIARTLGVDRLALTRAFRRVFGVSPAQYARAQRIENFKEQVRRPAMNVTTALYDSGFGSSSRLYENSNAAFGMKPRQLRGGAKNIQVNYTMTDSPLGRMLVAATEKGVCAIAFGDNDQTLATDLRERFSNAHLVYDDIATGWLAKAIRFVASQMTEHPAAADFPLDVRATAFQQRVWKALQEIPRGETRSYSGLAAEMGAPAATRAVARACATNPVALVVPCHRIVGKDGGLTGYRWGTERKRQLLDAENRPAFRGKRIQ